MKTYVITIEHDDHTYVCACDYTPEDPGRTYGPPEKCYPGYPAELEICEVICKIGDVEVDLMEGPQWMYEWVYDNLYDKLADKISDKLADEQAAADAEYYEQLREDERRYRQDYMNERGW